MLLYVGLILKINALLDALNTRFITAFVRVRACVRACVCVCVFISLGNMVYDIYLQHAGIR